MLSRTPVNISFILVMLLGTSLVVAAAGATVLKTSPNGQFKLYEERVPFHVAEKRCVEHGGILATVYSQEDWMQISSLFDAKQYAYIGGRVVDARSRTFAWGNGRVISSGNSPARCLQEVCPFKSGEPNNFNKEEDVIIASRSGWNDFNRDRNLMYVCQFFSCGQNKPLKTVRDGGDKFGKVTATTDGAKVQLFVESEEGAGFVVGPSLQVLRTNSAPPGVMLASLVWKSSETEVASFYRQPHDNLQYDADTCLLTMTKPIDHFCGPREDIPDFPTHYARECNVTMCKVYAANDQKTQVRVAMCNSIDFEIRFAKSEDCNNGASTGCSPSVRVFDWSTNAHGSVYYLRSVTSIGDARILAVECDSELMDCSTCRPTRGSDIRCLAKSTSPAKAKTERVTMKITAVGGQDHDCPPHTGFLMCQGDDPRCPDHPVGPLCDHPQLPLGGLVV